VKPTNKIKQQLHQACQQNIQGRIEAIQQKLDAIEESKNNETKSSAGDKYETGRAMMQIEADNSRRQLAEAKNVSNKLAQIKPEKTYTQVEPGSLVMTNKGNYYISIGIGKVKLNDTLYYCISENAPIGKLLNRKKTGDEVIFNGNKIQIKKVY